MTPDQPTAPGYSGLSKQEVAERLKQPTATATPRTDAELIDALGSIGVDKRRATALVEAAKPAIQMEHELAAAKAEVAEFQAELRIAQTKLCDALTEVEQVKHKLFIEEENRNQLAIIGYERDQLRARVAELEQDKANKCPQCEGHLIQPHDAMPYCENCGWPDENRPSPLVDNITDAVMAVVSPEGYDAEEREQIRAAIDNAIKNEQR